MWWPIIWAQFDEKTIFSPLNCLCSLIKDQLLYLLVSILGFPSVPMIYFSIFSPTACCHDYYSTKISLLLPRDAPAIYGSSQARSCSCWLMPQQCRIQATSATYTTAHSSTESLTQWVRPGSEPISLGKLAGFVTSWVRTVLKYVLK